MTWTNHMMEVSQLPTLTTLTTPNERCDLRFRNGVGGRADRAVMLVIKGYVLRSGQRETFENGPGVS